MEDRQLDAIIAGPSGTFRASWMGFEANDP
jgi:hypothetical protein